MIIRCIDFETTGIPTPEETHSIVEVGWSDLPATSYRSELVHPGRGIPFEAMAVHHITEAMIQDAPTLDDIWPQFGDGADYFAAHNADYERQFIRTEIPFICTWKVALRVWPDLPQHGLQYLRYALALPVNKNLDMPHRAGPDAYLCALLLERILAEPTAPDIETMVRWSNGHALLPRCPLFKHKGKKWEDVPADYLDWIVNKPNDVAADVKANAKLHLSKRVAA